MSSKTKQVVFMVVLINTFFLFSSQAILAIEIPPIEFCSNTTVSIPDNEPIATSQTLSISDMGKITDLDIILDVTHEHIGELSFYLEHEGTSVTLFEQPGHPASSKGCLGQDISKLTIDDDGSKSLEDDCLILKPAYNNSKSYQPADLLSNFDNINGDWILTFSDSHDYSKVSGTVNQWCLKYQRESQAVLSFAPAKDDVIAFGDTAVAETAYMTITLTEQDQDDFSISAEITADGVTASTNDEVVLPDDFAIVEPEPPSAIIKQNQTITFKIACTPSTGKTSIAKLVLSTNISALPTIEYPLSCKGLASSYSAEFEGQSMNSGAEIDFGQVDVKQSLEKTFQITNGSSDINLKLLSANLSGDSDDFHVTIPTSFPHSISANATEDFTVKCTPSKMGLRQAQLKLETNDPDNQNILYELKCTGMASVYKSTPISPNDSLFFGTSITGEVVQKTFTIKNQGNKELDIDASFAGGGVGVFTFSLSVSFPIGIGESAIVTVECKPTSTEHYVDTFTLITNAPLQENLQYPLSCSGTDKIEALYYSTPVAPEGTFHIGDTPKGVPVENSFKMIEVGNKPLTVSLPSITENEFEIIAPDFPITIDNGGDDVIVTVQCTPAEYGQREATLKFISTDEENKPTSKYPQPTYTLTCLGKAPKYKDNYSPDKIKFGTESVGKTVTKKLTITEKTGEAPLEIGLLAPPITEAFANNFRITSPNPDSFPFTISAGDKKTIKIECKPSLITTHTATLHLTSNDPSNPNPTYQLECIGKEVVGIGYGSTPMPGSTIDFGSTPMGVTVKKTLKIEEIGTAVLDIESYQIMDNLANDFGLVDDSMIPFYISNGKAGKEIEISCTPQAEGKRTATLRLTTTDKSNKNPTYPLECFGEPALVPGYDSVPTPDSKLVFGSALLGNTLTQTIEIQEMGNTDLQINSATLVSNNHPDDFKMTSSNLPVTIADGSGQKVTVTVACKPSSDGLRTAQLEITSDDPNHSSVFYDLECIGKTPVQIPSIPSTATLRVEFSGDGTGNVTSTPRGIDCNTHQEHCDYSYPRNITITLTATATASSEFTGWTGHQDCQDGKLQLKSNTTCVAHFQPIATTVEFPLTIIKTGTGAGTITSQPAGINCGTDCTADYLANTTVTLAATALENAIFTGWNQDCTGASNSFTVTMEAAKICIAQFETILTQPVCPETQPLYVNTNVQGDATGVTWQNAFPDLQTALTFASHCPNIEQIWVAKGTYYPTNGSEREATFQLLTGVAIYGGFVGTETLRQQRDITNNLTILSGDIGIPNEQQDNSYHVITGNDVDATAILDGFTITGGNANQGELCPDACGGGIFNDNGSPTLNHLLIRNNNAIYGAGLFNWRNSHSTLQNSIIKNNISYSGGGMINFEQSSPLICHVFVTDNIATDSGGGIVNKDDSNATLRHVTLTNNQAIHVGGGILNDNSSPIISHSILLNNTATEGAGIVNRNHSTPLLSHIIVNGNKASQSGGAIYNQQSHPTLSQVTITGNLAAQGGGLVNIASSPEINNSIIWDNTDDNDTIVLAQISDDENSETTVNYSIVQGGWNGNGNHNQDKDPLFMTIVDDSTTHLTADNFHLQPDSPAIDAGHNDLIPIDKADAECKGGDGNTTKPVELDFAAKPRQFDGNGDGIETVDMGVYESQATLLPNYSLTVIKTGTGNGTVISTQAGINCGTVCSQDYLSGTEVMLMADAEADSIFMGWQGACQGTHSSFQVDMTQAMLCEAQFDKVSHDTTTPTPDTPTSDTSNEVPCLVDTSSIKGVICNLEGKLLEDVKIHSDSILSNLVLIGTIENEGWLSNATILPDTTVTGGIFTGYITNDGIMADFEFRGASITGGILADTINNSSPINGIIQDVHLAANTSISGGKIAGQIIGDPAAPALLSNLTIMPGTYLENVILGENVTFANDITYGPGVQSLNSQKGTLAIVIDKPFQADQQTLSNVTITEKGKLSNVILEQTIINFGEVSDATLQANSQLTGGILRGEITNHGTIVDVNFRGKKLTGGLLAGFIKNSRQAIIQDVKLAPNTQLHGGNLQGHIQGDEQQPAQLDSVTINTGSLVSNVIIGQNVINEGTIADSEFRGSELSGGTLAGNITNTMGGTIRDVRLAPNTSINGGNLQGNIIGDPNAPALLENVIISAGSSLEHVIIGDNVTLANDVKLGAGVQFANPPADAQPVIAPPQPTCFKITPNGQFQPLYQGEFQGSIHTGDEMLSNHAMLTYSQAESLQLSTTIAVLPEHVGQPAELLIVAIHQDDNRGADSMRVLQDWKPWDNQIKHLKVAKVYQQLPEILEELLYQGDLANIAAEFTLMSNGHLLSFTDTAGEYTIYVGYRLTDGTIIFNGVEPIHFFVERAPDSCILYALHDDKLNDSQPITIDLSAGLQGDMQALGPMRKGRDMEGLALHPTDLELLFASAGDHANVAGQELDGYLYTIHRETGKMKVIGPTGFDKVAGLAFNPADKTLWGWGRNEKKNNKWTGIIKIDILTGKGTPIKQFNYQQHDMGGLAWDFDGNKLYASGDHHLWVYDSQTQTLEIACDYVDDGRIEGLDLQPNGFLLVGVDRKGKNNRETRILAYDPIKCQIVHKRVYEGLKYDDIESIVWPAAECNDLSWLSDH